MELFNNVLNVEIVKMLFITYTPIKKDNLISTRCKNFYTLFKASLTSDLKLIATALIESLGF